MKSPYQKYPRTIICKDGEVVVTPLQTSDEENLALFIKTLPNHDLLFLNRDITQPKVLSAWIHAVESGAIHSLIATRDEQILGTTAIVNDPHSWSSHVGELRVLVSNEMRDQGLGRILIQQSFILGLELGLEKLVAQMTPDQESAIQVFEDLGFRIEAMLRDHVMDSSGQKHDLLMLCHDVEQFHAHQQAYGLPDAF